MDGAEIALERMRFDDASGRNLTLGTFLDRGSEDRTRPLPTLEAVPMNGQEEQKAVFG
jgi:hypothetical protein